MRRSSSRSCSLCARARAADPSPAPLPPLFPPLLPLLPVALPRPPARSPGIHHAFSGRRAALVDREAHTCTRPRRRLGRPRLGSRRRLGLGRVVRVRRLLPRRACACARASLGTGTGTGVGGSVWRERAARRVERAPRRRGRRSGCVGRELARGADEDWAAVRRFLSLSLVPSGSCSRGAKGGADGARLLVRAPLASHALPLPPLPFLCPSLAFPPAPSSPLAAIQPRPALALPPRRTHRTHPPTAPASTPTRTTRRSSSSTRRRRPAVAAAPGGPRAAATARRRTRRTRTRTVRLGARAALTLLALVFPPFSLARRRPLERATERSLTPAPPLSPLPPSLSPARPPARRRERLPQRLPRRGGRRPRRRRRVRRRRRGGVARERAGRGPSWGRRRRRRWGGRGRGGVERRG